VIQLGRAVIVLGLLLVVVGVLLTFADRLPFRIGRLPGDIVIRGRNTSFYIPLMTCLLLSLLLTLVSWLFSRR
jgi:hypothetical protein